MKSRYLILLVLLPIGAFASAQKLAPATDSQAVLFGPLASSTDGSAHTTTVDDADIIVCQDSTSCAAKSSTTDCTHTNDGVHSCPLNVTDTTADESVCLINSVASTLPLMQCFEIEAPSFTDLRNGTTDLLTSEHAGLELETTVDTVTSQTVLVLAGGATNDDAYPKGSTIVIEGGAEKGAATICDYAGSTATVTLCAAVPFTVEVADEVRIHSGASPVMLAAVEDDTSTTGVAICTDCMDADAVASDAVTELQAGLATTAGVSDVQNTADALDGKIDTVQSGLEAIQGATFDTATDSLEAIRNRGDTAWPTISAAAVRTAIGLATANLDTQFSDQDDEIADLKAGIILGSAVTGTLSTTVATTNLTGYGDNQLIGRVIIWLSGPAEGEASPITDYDETNGTVTFEALTVAPANGNLFKIV